MGKIVPKDITNFLGLNENPDGQTGLKLGESPNMINWRVTDNMKLKKVEGYIQLFSSISAKNIQGTWYGSINGTYHFLFACNGHIYEQNLSTNANTDLGTLTDDVTSFFISNNIVYIQNGHEFKKWTGTGSITTVTGYAPLIAIGTPPSGGGTDFESINLLTGQKRQTFTPTATGNITFYIREQNVTSIDSIKVSGVVPSTIAYSALYGTVTVTISSGDLVPDSVEVVWTKGTGNRSLIEGQYCNMFFGGSSDSRVFLWGKDNTYYYSGIGNGVPNVEYFPAGNYASTDANGFKITDIVRQYDRQIIYTNKPEAYYSYYETTTDTNGNVIPSFPLFRLNGVKGMIAPNQTRIINNNPFTINEGIYNWNSTNVRDERNAVYISQRIQPSLDEVTLKNAITCDWEKKGEYWLCVGKTVWVYQYHVDVWFKFVLNDTPTSFIVIDDKLYFGTTTGQIMAFKSYLRSFNGVSINSDWEMGFYDVDVEWLRKFTNKTYISLKPENRSLVEVYWETNKDESSTSPVEIFYNNMDFDDMDFDDFTFLGNYNPQPFKLKTKAKKWTYFKLILKSHSDKYTATVISINLLPRIGGESK